MTNYRAHNVLILILFTMVFTGCATVSFDEPKPFSKTITDTENTRLGKDVSKWVDTHGELSGFFPLFQGMDALGRGHHAQ